MKKFFLLLLFYPSSVSVAQIDYLQGINELGICKNDARGRKKFLEKFEGCAYHYKENGEASVLSAGFRERLVFEVESSLQNESEPTEISLNYTLENNASTLKKIVSENYVNFPNSVSYNGNSELCNAGYAFDLLRMYCYQRNLGYDYRIFTSERKEAIIQPINQKIKKLSNYSMGAGAVLACITAAAFYAPKSIFSKALSSITMISSIFIIGPFLSSIKKQRQKKTDIEELFKNQEPIEAILQQARR